VGALTRRAWNGWRPDVDKVNGPAEALLRADNLQLDEMGALALRLGSSKINGSPLTDRDVRSLFTAVLNGTRYRFAGVSDSVYMNGAKVTSFPLSSADIAFGSYQGQVFVARETSKSKSDGTTVRNWGIAQTGGAPTVAGLAADAKTFATCKSADAEFAWTYDDATGAGYQTGYDGVANAAAVLRPKVADGIGIITKTFGGATDFTTYTGGKTGDDNDTIEFYFFLTAPASFISLTLDIDVNDGTFLQDYYSHVYSDPAGHPPEGPRDPRTQDGIIDGNFRVTGHDRTRINAITAGLTSGNDVPRAPRQFPAGWTRLQIPRASMSRVGATFGKDWATVKAVRFTVTEESGGVNALVAFQSLRIFGSTVRTLSGKCAWTYVLARNTGTYVALSAPSSVSATTQMNQQGATVTVPADVLRDSQVNEIWLYRMDDAFDDFYRVAVQTAVSGTGSVAIDDTMSDADALDANIPLQENLGTPPNSIIGIAGPYYDRLFCLTATDLYPSKGLNPDSFDALQVIHIAGADEVALWVAKTYGGLFIGTTKDIYVLEGDGTENADRTVNFLKRPLNIDYPPISPAFAQEGNLLIYQSANGWRVCEGTHSASLSSATSLLYRGITRHGVSAPNLATGRFRACVAHGKLWAITPEGVETDTTKTVYRYANDAQRWERCTYSTALRSIAREPDGTLIAGDNNGTVWILDDPTATGDAGATIPVVLWTKCDDAENPFIRKDPGDLHVRLDSGNTAMALDVHLDGSDTSAITLAPSQNGIGVSAFDLATVLPFKQVQLRLTGNVTSLHWYDFILNYRDRPAPVIGRVVSTNQGTPGQKVLTGFEIKLNTFGVARRITPILDNAPTEETFSVTTDTYEPETRTLTFTGVFGGAPLAAVDIGFSVDGDIELYEWQPLYSTLRPTGVKIYDTGPLNLGAREFVWLRYMYVKVRATADLTIEPFMDNHAWPKVTVPVRPSDVGVDMSIPVSCGRGFFGRTPRLVITSSGVFYPYSVRCIERQTGLVTGKSSIDIPLVVR
jgi:hypothetical protein